MIWTMIAKETVEPVHFLQPAWSGKHPADLWPGRGLRPLFRRWAIDLCELRTAHTGLPAHQLSPLSRARNTASLSLISATSS
jgi:hypothetical protein